MKLNKKQREFRDEETAKAAIRMAASHGVGKKIGIGVDDMPKVALMVERVERIATTQSLTYKVEKTDVGAYVHFAFGKGCVYVFAADKLAPPSQRPN